MRESGGRQGKVRVRCDEGEWRKTREGEGEGCYIRSQSSP